MITTRCVPFDAVAAKCSSFYDTFTPDVYGDTFCHFGVYVYNGWTSARAVPILVRPDVTHASSSGQSTSIRKLDVDYWISKPADIAFRTWVRVCKEYPTCIIVYYASIPSGPDGVPSYIPGALSDTRVADVGDVLYIKLDGGDVVDVEDEGFNELFMHDIIRYL